LSEFLSDYLNFCRAKTPSLGSVTNLDAHLANVISPDILKLKASVLERARSAVRNIYAFAHNREWHHELRPRLEPGLQAVLDVHATPSSVLMGYDFHYDPESDRLGLIEINTNSSMYLPAALLYEFHGKAFANDPVSPLQKLRDSFFAEWGTHNSPNKNPRVAIVDEDIEKQKMYFEFLMYKDFFESWGWSAQIIEVDMIDPNDFDFIYNRFVDFYLARPNSKLLRDAWVAQKTLFSPHPREYLLLADKERLRDFFNHNVDPSILRTERIRDLLGTKTGEALSLAVDEIWARRKKLFFKPRNMYGGKAAFRGNTITKKAFAEIFEGDFIAQEYLPAGEINGKKFDLRFFVYRNEIQNACARIYSGQTTNFNSAGGGISAVEFI
jgi:hypothetical protein